MTSWFTKVDAIITQQQTQKPNNNQTPVTTTVGVGQGGTDDVLKERLDFLGIDYENYLIYCEKYKNINFAAMTKEEQLKHLKTVATAATTTRTITTASKPFLNRLHEDLKLLTSEKSLVDEAQRLKQFDFNTFESQRKHRKNYILTLELARNTYLYGDKNNIKTPEDWNNLSKEEKEKLCFVAMKTILNKKIEIPPEEKEQLLNEGYTEEEILFLYSNSSLTKLENILMANSKKMSLMEFEKTYSQTEKDDLFITTFSNPTNNAQLADSQKQKMQNFVELYKAWYEIQIKELSKEKGNEALIKELQAKLTKLEETPHAQKINELEADIINFNASHKTQIAISDLEEIVLKKQIDSGKITGTKLSILEKKHKYLQEFNKSNLKLLINHVGINELLKEQNAKQLDDATKAEIGIFDSENELSPDEKIEKINEFLNTKFKTVSDQTERTEIVFSLIYELLKEDNRGSNGAIILKVHETAIKLGGEEFENALDNELNLLNITLCSDNVGKGSKKFMGNTIEKINTAEKTYKGTRGIFKFLRRGLVQNSTSGQLLHTNENGVTNAKRLLDDPDWDSAGEEIALKTVETSHVNEEDAQQLSGIIRESEHTNAKVTLARESYNASENLQYQMLYDATYNCDEATKVATEENVISKFAIKNQATAFQLLQDNIQTQLKDEDVDNYLSMLADTIKNLDPTVQQEALNHIYESGNQTAINKAVENLTNAPQVIQEAVLQKVISEAILNSVDLKAPELEELDLTQKLTANAISSLSPEQRKTYYTNVFIKASASEKIKLLSKIPDGTQKKTIYTIIARFEPRLLENMVENGMGKQMLSSNLPMDASNKVLKAMLKSENPEVKKQVAEIRKDKNFTERIENMETSFEQGNNTNKVTENSANQSYMTTPNDFASHIGLTPEDIAQINKKGMFARFNNGGFKA